MQIIYGSQIYIINIKHKISIHSASKMLTTVDHKKPALKRVQNAHWHCFCASWWP